MAILEILHLAWHWCREVLRRLALVLSLVKLLELRPRLLPCLCLCHKLSARVIVRLNLEPRDRPQRRELDPGVIRWQPGCVLLRMRCALVALMLRQRVEAHGAGRPCGMLMLVTTVHE